MPWIMNEDGSETDTGTGAVTVKPNHMAPSDRPVSEEDVVGADVKRGPGRPRKE